MIGDLLTRWLHCNTKVTILSGYLLCRGLHRDRPTRKLLAPELVNYRARRQLNIGERNYLIFRDIPAQHAVLLSVFGATGNGKSTAITLGLSVWGNPKRERHVKDSSPKSVPGQTRRFVDAPIASGLPLSTDLVRRGFFFSISRNRERNDGCCWPLCRRPLWP